jgi:hypothetical protein
LVLLFVDWQREKSEHGKQRREESATKRGARARGRKKQILAMAEGSQHLVGKLLYFGNISINIYTLKSEIWM